MLVDNYNDYSTDLTDIFDAELFNPSDFAIDSTTVPDYLDSFPISDFSLPQLQLPYFPSATSSSSSLSSPSPFLIDNDHVVNHPIGIDPQLVDTPSAVTDHGDDDDSDLEELLPPSTLPSTSATTQKPTITIPPTSISSSNNTSTKSASASTTTAHKSRKGTVLSGGIVKKSLHSSSAKEKENTALSLGVAAAKKTAASKHAKNPSVASSSSSSSSPFGLSTISEPNKLSFASLMASAPKRAPSEMSADNDDDNDQELPQDWRPSPEVLAKMTSKEKRQLRNKISARNFRIRRKEYISTLEGDIAQRDRLLDHFRTQLGTRESENLALRQEIAALKKALLDGRSDASALSDGEDGMMILEDGVGMGGLNLHLPPPKMLPEQSAAEALMLAETTQPASATVNTTMGLLTPNTQKDLPTSRVGSSTSSGFWGGVGMGAGGMGGITPVHTTLVPDMSVVLKRALMENINPSLNQGQARQAHSHAHPGAHANGALGGFDGFADAHPFTLKTLDAYRMHLWGKMAAQQSHHHQNQHQHHSPSSSRTSSPSPPASPSSGLGYLYPGYGHAGLAERLRPHFFSSSGMGLGSFGKHALSSSSSSGYPTPPPPTVFAHKSIAREKEKDQQQQQQQQQALFAAMASQTILKKLGNAFWDAFVGSSSTLPSSSSAAALGAAYTTTSNGNGNGSGNWDADKVKRILEGKAVLRVVDVDSLPPLSTGAVSSTTTVPAVPVASEKVQCERKVCELLEESMRSLTIGKKG